MPDTDTPSAEALAGELELSSTGYDEWRVQDPADGSYCISYAWPDSLSPEREAVAWLADHKARFPDSQFAGYKVACVRVRTPDDAERVRAAAMLRSLAAERDALRAALDGAQAPRDVPRLTDEDVWRSDEIMSINAAAGMHMPTLMRLVRAIESRVRELCGVAP